MRGNGGTGITSGRDVNSVFPHKACINLDRRPERWMRMQARFAEYGIKSVMRFPAVDGSILRPPPEWGGAAGAYGCARSNIEIVEMARRKRWPSILIFEDDVGFDPSFSVRFPHFYSQVPPEWDMLFLGGMHRSEPAPVSENVVKLSGTTSTYAYALKDTIYDAFIELNTSVLQPVDVNNYELQRRFNCYCFVPHLAWADADYSDTHGRAVNPWWLKESLVLGGAEMERVQERTAIVIPHRDRSPDRRGVRNLRFIVEHYRTFLSGATTVVVEQDTRRSVSPRDLPDGCIYLQVYDESEFNRARCFNAALKLIDMNREFVIFADRDICSSWDLKAGLKKCLEYDFVSSFSQVFDLDEADTQRVINGERIDTSAYLPRRPTSLCSEFCIFTRRAIEETGGWVDDHPELNEILQARKVSERFRVFETPGWTLKLHADSGRTV